MEELFRAFTTLLRMGLPVEIDATVKVGNDTYRFTAQIPGRQPADRVSKDQVVDDEQAD